MGLSELQRAPREVVHGVRSDGFRLGLQTVYAPWLTDIFREYGGSWHPTGRMWVFPRAAVTGAFAQRLAKEAPSGVVFTVQRTLDLITNAVAEPDRDLFAEGLDVQIYPVAGGEKTVVHFKRDALLNQVMQQLGGRVLQGRTGWVLDLTLDTTIAALATHAGVHRDYIYLHDSEIVLADISGAQADDRPSLGVGGRPQEGAGAIEVESSGSVLSVLTSPLRKHPISSEVRARIENEFGLYDFQQEGVLHFASQSSALNADDMGLGKTRQGIVAAEVSEGTDPVLVICPAALKINFEREIHAVLPDARVAMVGQHDDWESAQWVIVNYERLGAVVQAMNEKRVRFRAMLCDEAHLLKEPTSGRTRNAFLIAKHVERRFLLTATPILNRESELHTLLKLSGHPIGELDAAEFSKQFAGSPEVRKALKERIAEWMIRRPKAVVKGLKGKSTQLQYVELASDDMRQYRQAANDPDSPALVKIGVLRQLLERFKSRWLIDTIQSMAPEDKVIVFCEHLEIVSILSDELAAAGIGSVSYIGSMSDKKKQQAVDQFQTDPQIRVFVGMRKAAGVGLTLTAANYVIMHSLPWNAALRRQAEDRAYRNGQTRHVTILIPIVPRTIDEKVLDLNRHKESIERDSLGDGEAPPDPTLILENVA
ncbi:MAG: DEAD/DEAH box helicase [Burkholderiaceae bacterium]|nr:MAG: DEAD/DEAH box helicase [Burkholderiaceae bacterium]